MIIFEEKSQFWVLCRLNLSKRFSSNLIQITQVPASSRFEIISCKNQSRFFYCLLTVSCKEFIESLAKLSKLMRRKKEEIRKVWVAKRGQWDNTSRKVLKKRKRVKSLTKKLNLSDILAKNSKFQKFLYLEILENFRFLNLRIEWVT